VVQADLDNSIQGSLALIPLLAAAAVAVLVQGLEVAADLDIAQHCRVQTPATQANMEALVALVVHL
jgi:hypothetical protein